MKATIETFLRTNFAKHPEEIEQEFMQLLKTVMIADSETDLRNALKFKRFNYFIFGFGSSHFWAKQVPEITNSDYGNIIFIQL